jgi:hypothetical protein
VDEMEKAVVELQNASTSWAQIGRDPQVNRSPARAKAIFLRWEADRGSKDPSSLLNISLSCKENSAADDQKTPSSNVPSSPITQAPDHAE